MSTPPSLFVVAMGAAVGLVIALACLMPQLIDAPGLLDPIQHLSFAMLAFTAGRGLDAKFRRMLQEAESLPVSVPR